MLIFCKKKKKTADINKIMKALVLKGIFSEAIYVCVFTNENSSFQCNSNKFQAGGGKFTPSPTSKRTPKEPTQIRVKMTISQKLLLLILRTRKSYMRISLNSKGYIYVSKATFINKQLPRFLASRYLEYSKTPFLKSESLKSECYMLKTRLHWFRVLDKIDHHNLYSSETRHIKIQKLDLPP